MTTSWRRELLEDDKLYSDQRLILIYFYKIFDVFFFDIEL